MLRLSASTRRAGVFSVMTDAAGEHPFLALSAPFLARVSDTDTTLMAWLLLLNEHRHYEQWRTSTTGRYGFTSRPSTACHRIWSPLKPRMLNSSPQDSEPQRNFGTHPISSQTWANRRRAG